MRLLFLLATIVAGTGQDACWATVGLLGDYDVNGEVNPADAAVWKAALGTSLSLPADGDGNGIVDAIDYLILFAHMGESISGSEPDATPADLIYNPATGDVVLDQTKANGGAITAFFLNGGPLTAPGVANFPYETPVVSGPYSVSTEVDASFQVAQIDVNVTGLPSTQFLLGPVLPTSLTLPQVQSALASSFYMAAFGGPESFNIVIIPEPASLLSVAILAAIPACRWRRLRPS